MLQPLKPKNLKLNVSMKISKTFYNTKIKDVLFITEDWNAKVGSQELPGLTGKFGLGVQNEAGKRLTETLCREHTGHSKHPLPTTGDDSTNGHHQMVSTKIRLIILFAAEDGEALQSQQSQDLELNVVHLMSSLQQNSGLN